MPNPLVPKYVDAAVAQLRRLDLMRRPGHLPDQMRDPSIPPSDDWIGWKTIPSTVADSDLDGLERETGLAFPPLYRVTGALSETNAAAAKVAAVSGQMVRQRLPPNLRIFLRPSLRGHLAPSVV